jgi:hypothetical protein
VHAVVTTVTINDQEAAENHLNEQVVPGVKQAPGLVNGYWARKENSGMALVVFESEEVANDMAERIPSMLTDAVTLENVEVREVVAHT